MGRRTDRPVPEVTAGRQLVGAVGAQGLLLAAADVAYTPQAVLPTGAEHAPRGSAVEGVAEGRRLVALVCTQITSHESRVTGHDQCRRRG